MTIKELIRHRLHAQQLVAPQFSTPGEVVSWLGAVQAQDYLGSLWSIGQRLNFTARDADIEKAITDKQLIRTWPMRGTLHFVTPRDIRWMLKYLTPRVFRRVKPMLRKEGIDDRVLRKSRKLWLAALEGGEQLTRDDLYQILEKNKISTKDTRGLHILAWLAQEGLICFTARHGKQHRFALLDEWVPPHPIPEKDEALSELAARYFTSHGPATIGDFVWWAGLTKAEAIAALDPVESKLIKEKIGDRVYWHSGQGAGGSIPSRTWLLPTYDEYGIAYKDRSAILGVGIKIEQSAFTSLIAYAGKGVGLWRRTLGKDGVIIETRPFGKFSSAIKKSTAATARKYGEFVGRKVELEL